MQKKIATNSIIVLFLTVFVLQQSIAQKTQIDSFLKNTNLKHANIGLKVVEVSTEKIICSYNEELSLCPASCMKLVSTATALELLGDNFTYTTTIFTDGEVDAQGVLKGNLFIKGVGDPTLGSEFINMASDAFMEQWTVDIRKAGVNAIEGNVIALDGLFGYEGVSPYWTWADIGNYYAPGIYGLSLYDNMYKLNIKSGAAGTKPEITGWEPSSLPLKFENNLKVTANNTDSAYIYGKPFDNERQIFGSIPQQKTSFIIKGDIPDPGLYLASCFTEIMKKSGVIISGKPISNRTENILPTERKILSQTISPNLGKIIQVVNFRSNNHYAEHLYRKIAYKDEIIEFWNKKGLDTNALFMYDGSGLSPQNAVSAGFFTDLLCYMSKRSKYADAFFQSLPRTGKEGTVAGFLKNTSLEGSTRAKSGGMEGVISYSGYSERNGKQYAFSIIINKYNGSRAMVRQQIEKLLVGVLDNP